MKWLQSIPLSGTTRFNRLRKERGHVFEGRYRAILIGSSEPLLGLVDYVHLNPVRAGICLVSALKGYALSSYPKYFKRKVRDGLCREKHPGVVWEGSELKELNEAMWEGLVENALSGAGKTETDLRSDPKGAPWKAKIARELRTRTTVANPWIAKRLNMGHPSRVTHLIREHPK